MPLEPRTQTWTVLSIDGSGQIHSNALVTLTRRDYRLGNIREVEMELLISAEEAKNIYVGDAYTVEIRPKYDEMDT